MPRKATGAVVCHEGRDGRTYRGLRFTAYGRRRYLGLGPVTAAEAERELRHVMADVDRGTWQPPAAVEPPPEPVAVPTFHQLAEAWWQDGEPGWAENTRKAYRYELEVHLLPAFGERPVDRITIADVDGYRAGKLRDLSAAYVNKHLTRLGAILDLGVERGYVERNPVRVNPRRRRARADRHEPVYLDRAEHIAALLDAAGELDRTARRDSRALNRRCLMAVLAFGGLRISEALALRWRDVDLPNGRLRVAGTKTDAAAREFVMLPALAGELRAHKAGTRMSTVPGALVFPTNRGTAHLPNNTRRRVLHAAVKLADAQLGEDGYVPLPDGLTQHGLRHTYASARVALGHDVAVIARDGGWRDLSTLQRTYTHVMALDDGSRGRLRALVEGRRIGRNWQTSPQTADSAALARAA